MSGTVIDRLYSEHAQLTRFLLDAGEMSLVNIVDEGFRKTLLLSAASYFEAQIRELLISFVRDQSGGDDLIIAFLKNKAIERQYHSYFKWPDKNANQFFGLFGPKFKVKMEALVKADRELDTAIRAFLELGDLRNNLVHRDYAMFPIDKTVDEIYALYCTSLKFVEALPTHLRTPATAASTEGTV